MALDASEDVRPIHRRVWSGLGSDDPQAEIGVLGIPFDGAVSFRKGAAFAPKRIRELTPHMVPVTEEGKRLTGLRLRDYGDVIVDLDWERHFENVKARAQEVLRHELAVFLGGDHSVTIPLVAAFAATAQDDFAVIHLDSHPDLAASFEGHRWSHACSARRVLELPHMDPRHLALVGVRAFLDEELIFLASHPEIIVHTAREVYQHGAEKTAEAIAGRLEGASAVYVTVDIDVLDPAFAPGTGTPEAGGVSTRDLLELLRVLFERLPVRALDLVEVAPPLDCADITSFAAAKVIYEAFGWTAKRLGRRTWKPSLQGPG
jgi:agmatinase